MGLNALEDTMAGEGDESQQDVENVKRSETIRRKSQKMRFVDGKQCGQTKSDAKW